LKELHETLREIVSDAIRYWEHRRPAYNVVLVVVVAVSFHQAWPASRASVSLATLQVLFVLAVLANVLYCAAYVVDLFAQYSQLRSTWLRYRWVLFVVGVLFAASLANFTSSDLFRADATQGAHSQAESG
jgi:hypothetical protein